MPADRGSVLSYGLQEGNSRASPWEGAGGDGGAPVPKRGAPVLEPSSQDQSHWGNPSLQQLQWP